MRLATFIAPGGSEPLAGEVRDGEVVAFGSGTVRDRLESGDLSPAGGDAYALASVTLLAPVPRPRAIFGIGRNYAAHAAELGNDAAEAAAGVHEAPELERPAVPGRSAARRSSSSSTTRPSLRS